MLDYQALTAVVSATQAAFAAKAPSLDPGTVAAVDASFGVPGPFMLGALYQHLLRHAGPSVPEIARLEAGVAQWQAVIVLFDRIAALRATVENLVLSAPDEGKIDTANQAAADATSIQTDLTALLGQAQNLIATLAPVDYLGSHPVAAGQAVADWPWFELSIARRSGAFAANLALLAQSSPYDTVAARAFAHGALVGYAANARGGGDFLNDVVGGARRDHLYRHKLAANTVGAWLAVHDAAGTMPLSALRDLIGETSADAVAGLVKAALSQTYPTLAAKPLPDVAGAAATMAHHLDLLTRFTPLPQPVDSPAAVLRLVDDTGAYGAAQAELSTKSLHPVAPAGYFSKESPFSDNSALDWVFSPCEALAWILVKIVEAFNWVLVQLGAIKRGSPAAASQTQAVMNSQGYLVAVELCRTLQYRLYSECQDALTALKLLGIAYPEPQDLAVHPFDQFTAIPAQDLAFRLPPATPGVYLEYPATSLELPAAAPSPRSAGQPPTTILDASAYAVDLLAASTGPHPEPAAENADTDADRGYGALCWQLLSPPGVNPLSAAVLAYTAI